MSYYTSGNFQESKEADLNGNIFSQLKCVFSSLNKTTTNDKEKSKTETSSVTPTSYGKNENLIKSKVSNIICEETNADNSNIERQSDIIKIEKSFEEKNEENNFEEIKEDSSENQKTENDICLNNAKSEQNGKALFNWPEICNKAFERQKMISSEQFLNLKENPEDIYEENIPAMKYLNIIQDSYSEDKPEKNENKDKDMEALTTDRNSGVKMFNNEKYNEIYEALMIWQEDFETDGKNARKADEKHFGLNFGSFF